MHSRPIKRTLLVALPLGILIGAAGAYAANRYLDEADTHVDRAIEALQKANNPAERGEYGGHRVKAIGLLGEVKRQIKKAKEFDEKHPSKPEPEPRPDAGPMPVPSGHPGHQPKPSPTGGPTKPNPNPGDGSTKPDPNPGDGSTKPPVPTPTRPKK
jgi:hypothetical protein